MDKRKGFREDMVEDTVSTWSIKWVHNLVWALSVTGLDSKMALMMDLRPLPLEDILGKHLVPIPVGVSVNPFLY
jgi:hypothetical protein